ncbi:hypothetical protein BIV57_12355 [Mangrovactinospora gilvigrisea]|uniref:Uncharacterized protein n=1 Tax=Mangrovactinospora gilvigrisea TaxID=1428644 RepID=A0A1J7C6D2_9ACTN|nr:hypothetical protein [Mangrovactinospora gilvigrisea]OIV37120.1 hypothetical protein BIV57_12355 [Mangrovactinospora gilvigrisea]
MTDTHTCGEHGTLASGLIHAATALRLAQIDLERRGMNLERHTARDVIAMVSDLRAVAAAHATDDQSYLVAARAGRRHAASRSPRGGRECGPSPS